MAETPPGAGLGAEPGGESRGTAPPPLPLRGRGLGFAARASRLHPRQLLLGVERVAEPLDRPDRALFPRRDAELAPELPDPEPQVRDLVAVLGAPDVGEDLVVEQDPALV